LTSRSPKGCNERESTQRNERTEAKRFRLIFTIAPSGNQSTAIYRRHCLYLPFINESYLENLGYPEDHVHTAADRVEHFISPQLAEAVDAAAGNPVTDPHGKSIPRE
jgi:hypothetical protein